ncbi:branched-chain amino acid ABC transporter permease [Bosea massiliensis]|uniref:Branched-chain amino acid ABC transporter permease n=1 Tax=Bosea massiliensis TaxID=151419 RepID=A0ABW0P7M0_9HYPH
MMFYANLAMSGLVQGLLLATLALSISLCFSVAKFTNAATGDFMTVGAYVVVGTQALTNGSLIAGLLGSAAAVAGLSLVAYAVLFRHLGKASPVMALIASVGLALFVRAILTLFVGHGQFAIDYPASRAMNFNGFRVVPIDLWVAAGCVFLLGLVFAVLYLTPIGLQVRALADNRDLARSAGIKARRVMILLWALIGIVTAMGGALVGIKTVVIPEMGWHLILSGFAAAVLGGLGNPIGAVVAAVALGVLQELSTPWTGFVFKSIFSFGILIAALIWKPEGLFGRPEQVR